MSANLADIREYVVPLFVAEDPECLSPDQPVIVSRDRFLGTAFFISKNGVALTAAHCVPPPSSIPSGRAFLAIIWDGERPRAQQVQMASVLDNQDIAVLKIAHCPSKYFPVSFEPVNMGEDVATVGVPDHSVSGTAYEYRYLKGHVTMVSKTLELSNPAPRGMSGSPVLRNGHAVGVLSFNARSEALEDQYEEKTEQFGPITRVTKTITMSIINYGQAEQLSLLANAKFPFTGGVSFQEFIKNLNS